MKELCNILSDLCCINGPLHDCEIISVQDFAHVWDLTPVNTGELH